MNFAKLVPSIFYEDINEGLKLFVDCLGFAVTHSELHTKAPFCVLEKGDLQLYLFEDAKLAKEHNPELRIVTTNNRKCMIRFQPHIPIYYTLT